MKELSLDELIAVYGGSGININVPSDYLWDIATRPDYFAEVPPQTTSGGGLNFPTSIPVGPVNVSGTVSEGTPMVTVSGSFY